MSICIQHLRPVRLSKGGIKVKRTTREPWIGPIPAVCTVEVLCRVLNMAQSQLYLLRKQGTFPIPDIQPAIDKRPRFRGADVQAYIDGRLRPAKKGKAA